MFLHGHLFEDVYMSQPPGFAHPQFPNQVCKLKKALYGLKQSPTAWFSCLSSRLLALGFRGMRSDSSLFIYHSAIVTIYFLIYVDDLIVITSQPSAIDDLLCHLKSDFTIKDLGNLNFFLAVEVLPNSKGLILSQKRYVIDPLKKTKMLEAKPISSPMAQSTSLSTYPNICIAPHHFTGNLSNAFCIILNKRHHGLQLKCSSSIPSKPFLMLIGLVAMMIGAQLGVFVFFLVIILFPGIVKKQKTVARSSTEVEYKTLANATAKDKWFCALLYELGTPVPRSPVLWCINIGATYLSSNPVFHTRTKHDEIDFHFVRDMVANGSLVIHLLSSKDQLADIFTKRLSSSRFALRQTNLNVLPAQLHLRGRVKDQS
uniref:Reverse transcriptase Ty1/copia-type domain-containing protein n=1 Tax=Quercus lobata TaxID=97700 RepID=A0A7N2LDJ6_QUELO